MPMQVRLAATLDACDAYDAGERRYFSIDCCTGALMQTRCCRAMPCASARSAPRCCAARHTEEDMQHRCMASALQRWSDAASPQTRSPMHVLMTPARAAQRQINGLSDDGGLTQSASYTRTARDQRYENRGRQDDTAGALTWNHSRRHLDRATRSLIATNVSTSGRTGPCCDALKQSAACTMQYTTATP